MGNKITKQQYNECFALLLWAKNLYNKHREIEYLLAQKLGVKFDDNHVNDLLYDDAILPTEEDFKTALTRHEITALNK